MFVKGGIERGAWILSAVLAAVMMAFALAGESVAPPFSRPDEAAAGVIHALASFPGLLQGDAGCEGAGVRLRI